jgi:glutathione synthase/RimK-type ligase-like ATP-grasp enzyme
MVTGKKQLARVFVRPPERPSSGANTLRNAIGPLARLSRKVPTPQYKLVINWGNSTTLNTATRILNRPEKISNAVNKLSALRTLEAAGVPVPPFSTEKPAVKKGEIWLARTALTGSGGVGITPIRYKQDVPAAPLYVKYIKKQHEYRVHVVCGQVVFAQLKKRKSDAEQTDDQKLIRNYDNGWVFCPVELSTVAEDVKNVAIGAVNGLELDFGAVDLVLANDSNSAYALEVNTAPGLSSPGLIQAYSDAFLKQLR